MTTKTVDEVSKMTANLKFATIYQFGLYSVANSPIKNVYTYTVYSVISRELSISRKFEFV